MSVPVFANPAAETPLGSSDAPLAPVPPVDDAVEPPVCEPVGVVVVVVEVDGMNVP